MSGEGDEETFGFKVKLNHTFSEKWSPSLLPRWNQLWDLIPLGIRYIFYCAYIWFKGRRPLMDYFKVLQGKQIYGVPIGGIGSGTIGRGFKGEFCRYQFRPGMYSHEVIPGNQFIITVRNNNQETLYQSLLSCSELPKKSLQAWESKLDGSKCSYRGLYPRSWTRYEIPEQNLVITCRQISPVIPDNYKDSCIPGAVFVWDIENNSSETKDVSITFVFQNGIGEKGDTSPGCWNEAFKSPISSGVLIHHKIDEMPYTLGVSTKMKDEVKVSRLRDWNPMGDGSDVWNPLKLNGAFPDCDTQPSHQSRNKELLGCAVSSQIKISSNSKKNVEFSLVWHMPQINFGENAKKYWRYYTQIFGKEDDVAIKLSDYSFSNVERWEEEIEKWQQPVLLDRELPSWYKSALFNETYFVSDGGSIWIAVEESERKRLDSNDPRKELGHFAYLEGHEYRMYNTYDVHFYASFALSLLWPRLQTLIQRDFCDTIPMEDKSCQWHLYDGEISNRKIKNSIPHDLGDPGEEPFLKINAYPIHNVSEWRDLNLKFVLQCYRDFSLTQDLGELKSMWPNICVVMKGALSWDKDGDGLIENHGAPDQTYDTWIMEGPSAYCGSLWLAALQCTCKIATVLLDNEVLAFYSEILSRARNAFEEKLWNGKYYNFDSSNATKSKSIMSDQLCGLWYIKSSALENEILPEPNIKTALSTIYENNVLKLQNGTRGAVNGMMPDGKIDYYTVQSEEIWTGVVYGLASLMIHEGMVEEGFKTASGIYKTVYELIGQGYETPEALYDQKAYRSVGYMRALSIWSIQLAWELRKKKSITSK